MTGPPLEWYREQSEHNRRFYECLHRVRPRDAHDWKVIALFYSVLHKINYRFARETGRAPGGPHREEQAGERELPQVSKDYRKLYLMSMRARYRNGHRLVDSRRRLAVEKVDRIDGLLPFYPAQACRGRKAAASRPRAESRSCAAPPPAPHSFALSVRRHWFTRGRKDHGDLHMASREPRCRDGHGPGGARRRPAARIADGRARFRPAARASCGRRAGWRAASGTP